MTAPARGRGRIVDHAAASGRKLGFAHLGSAEVELESIEPGQAETPPQQAAAPAPSAAAPTERALAAPEQAAAVYVQVGAFSSRDNAENLRSRLEGEFGWLKDQVQVLAIGDLWRLPGGPYRTQDDARSVAERIESQLSIKPLLVVR